MSRTYRKHPYPIDEWIWKINPLTDHYEKFYEKPSKEKLARYRTKQWDDRNKGWYFHQLNKKNRSVTKHQFAKLKKCSDYEDYDFDDSEYRKMKKGIWWYIY